MSFMFTDSCGVQEVDLSKIIVTVLARNGVYIHCW